MKVLPSADPTPPTGSTEQREGPGAVVCPRGGLLAVFTVESVMAGSGHHDLGYFHRLVKVRKSGFGESEGCGWGRRVSGA